MTQPTRTVTINGKKLPAPVGCHYFFQEDGKWFFRGNGYYSIAEDYWEGREGFKLLPIIAAVAAEWFHQQAALGMEEYCKDALPMDQRSTRQRTFFLNCQRSESAWRSLIVWPQPETKDPTP